MVIAFFAETFVQAMFTAEQIDTLSKQRMRILGPAAIAGVVGTFAWLVAGGLIRHPLEEWTRQSVGDSAAELISIILILPSFLFFLAPTMWAERRAKAYSLSCPACNANLSQRTHRVLVTKCCSVCGVKVVEGERVRSREVFDRWALQNMRRFLVFWFWSWPALGLLVFVMYVMDPASISNCRNYLFLPGLIGTVTAGWTFVRTGDRRYLTPLMVSLVVFGVGAYLFW